MFIDDNGNLIPFKPKLKFLNSQFNTNINTLKNFIKKRSLKLKNHKDLKMILPIPSIAIRATKGLGGRNQTIYYFAKDHGPSINYFKFV